MAADKNGKKLPKGITQRSDGRYMGRFSHNGERYTLYDDNNLKRLEKAMNDMRYELEHGIYGDTKKMTMNKWFDIWLQEYKENSVKRSTLESYKQFYDLYIRKPLGGKYIKELRAIQIQKLCNDMAKRGLATNTIAKVELIINGMLEQACKDDMLLKNPCRGVTVPKIECEPRKVLTEQEQEAFLNYVSIHESQMFITLYNLQLGTGMRIGEILGLTWDKINYKDKTISIDRTLVYHKGKDKRQAFFQTPKTKTSKRVIPMLENVTFLLKKWQREQKKQIDMLGTHWQPRKDMENLVFTTQIGQPLMTNEINRRIHQIVDEINEQNRDINMQQFSSHSLRHTFATRCFENGIPPRVVQDFLGHASIKMTMDLYTHVLEDTKKDEIRKIEKLFKNA